MHISTKGRYGLEALVDLAIHYSGKPVSLKSIAERCHLSEEYILQIFIILRKAGIVRSRRGTRGGYVLAKDQSDITVGNVLTALEGPLAPTACISGKKEKACSRYEYCVTRILWEKIMTGIYEVADSITIKDLVNYCKNAAAGTPEPEYYI